MIRMVSVLAFAGLLAAGQPAAAATQIYNFTLSDPAATLGAGPYASVSVTESGGTLSFVETLLNGYLIHESNSNHHAFTFSILGNPNVTVLGLASGFSAISLLASSDVSAPPFGYYFTGIDCTTACGAGYAKAYAGPLTFSVSSANGPLTLASLGFNSYGTNQVYFTSDVINSAGKTGNAGAVQSTVSAVPEPSTWALMLLGFGASGYSLRRRRKVVLQTA